MSPTYLRDGNGLFVAASLAALWADTCDLCHERLADHVGLRPATGQPFCPVLATSALPTVTRDEALDALNGIGTPLDGISFDPCDISGCLAPTSHEVGCDCSFGVCR